MYMASPRGRVGRAASELQTAAVGDWVGDPMMYERGDFGCSSPRMVGKEQKLSLRMKDVRLTWPPVPIPAPS